MPILEESTFNAHDEPFDEKFNFVIPIKTYFNEYFFVDIYTRTHNINGLRLTH